jgi:hypothetical protein
MTYDDHWAVTRIKFQTWAANFGFIDEGDEDEGFRFVLDNSTTPGPTAMLGEIIEDLNLGKPEALVKRNLLIYFVAHLGGSLAVNMPNPGLAFCSIYPGRPREVNSQHLDKERLFVKYQDDTEELILELFLSNLEKCRRSHIHEVKT